MSWLPDWITGYDAANAQRAAEADRVLREQNAQIYANNPDAAAQAAKDYGSQGEISPDAQRAQIDQVFFDNIKDPVPKFLANIPWWFWLVLAGGLFLWMGGLSFLKGILK